MFFLRAKKSTPTYINNKKFNVPNTLITISDLLFSYRGRNIFSGLNLDIAEGKISAIMGPSGTGKTTLLRLIGGQLTPNQGDVIVEGKSIPSLSNKHLYQSRRRMGMLFQSGALLTDLSVFENIAFPIREHYNFPESMIRDLVFMKLEVVGLRGAYKLMPSELSGGMSRRVALARAIVLDPVLMMYDEPFTGLDPITLGTIVSLIKELNQALGMTSIVVSHDVKEVLSIADEVHIISNGMIAASGTPDELQNSDSDWVQQFLQGLPDGPVPFHYPATDYVQSLKEELK
ncbi:MAG TPA: ATP-binding cassette domain-containing protein [Leucothrix mucor]|uniref:ATP-binding cassette domain-containing protein n=1 Tax=Leucothrix mucor TaxID=45248 RepID=A0A7V2WV62_LEUMU|nr:ATP-binding cassette domain-containing protein [Leucothrix mucor]